MKTLRIVLTMLAVMLMVGCANSSQILPGRMLVDGEYQRVHASVTELQGSALVRSTDVIQVNRDTGLKDENGEAILEQVALETQTGPSLVGQLLMGPANTVLGTVIQGEYQQDAAKIMTKGGCGNGGCGGGGTQVVDVNVTQKSDVTATLSTGCPSGNCVAP